MSAFISEFLNVTRNKWKVTFQLTGLQNKVLS